MTTSGPEQNAPPGWIESQSDEGGIDAKQLEVGISGINLSSFTGGNRPPTLSGSSVSTNPEDQSHSRQHSFGSYNGNVDPAGGHRGTPPSPASPMYRGQSMPSFSTQGKPPGLSGPFPSPIGKAGSTNSTAMSSPHLTLTPSSSIDQGDVFSAGRQSSPGRQLSPLGSTIPSYTDQAEAGESIRRGGSPWREQPPSSIPQSVSAFSQPTQQKESGLGGAFSSASTDNEDFDSDLDDGLRGLGALRERAHSSPGPLMTAGGGGFAGAPFSSSPPVQSGNRLSSSPLGDFRDDGSYGNRSFPSDPRRSRTPSKDGVKAVSRPPLSGALSSTHNIFSEGNQGLLPNLVGPSGELSRSADWSDSSMGRGRSLSMGTMNTRDLMYIHQQDGDIRSQPHIDQFHAQKFGSMPSLSSHTQHQQRMPPQQSMQQQQFSGIQAPLGHVRSYSQPGPNQTGFRGQAELHENPNVFEHNLEYSPAGRGDIQYLDEGDSLHSGHVRGRGGGRYVQQVLPAQLSRSVSAGNGMHGVHPRNAGMSQFGGEFPNVRRSSYSGSQTQYHAGLQRRDALDFADGHPHREEPRPVMATREEMSMYGIHGREQEGYSIAGAGRYERIPQGGSVHSRHHSDGGGVLSSAMAQGSRAMRGDMRHRDSGQYGSSYEDNLDHPLAGEFIDDPIDDLGPHMDGRSERHDMGGVYGERIPPGHTSRHSFSSAAMLDQPVMVRHYSDAHHLAPALPTRSLPRTVYNIKFKRSQRNFIASPRINRDLDIGCYVKVEADRGEDLGIVVGKMTAEKFNQSAGRASFRPPSSNPNDLGASGTTPTCAADLKRVIRLATHDEVNLLTIKREEEDELLRICRTKVRQRALPMNVVDAEYQFDRHKLTFFFEAEGRVDFRELVRDLFSIYKTRIWMQQLDKNPISEPLSRGESPSGDGRDEYGPDGGVGVGPDYGIGGSNPPDAGRNEP